MILNMRCYLWVKNYSSVPREQSLNPIMSLNKGKRHITIKLFMRQQLIFI